MDSEVHFAKRIAVVGIESCLIINYPSTLAVLLEISAGVASVAELLLRLRGI
ncbi:hypothetical protein [Porphyromonas endodontalis]|uniref:hypothetical protein n=1 Tax=Porphyromonas endodontalis TaxID=28124 RepID=UPI0028EC1296|nr:hypothetical protein [Porphyromonas endodontalis]